MTVTVEDKSFTLQRKGLPLSIFNFLIDQRVKALNEMVEQMDKNSGFISGSAMYHSPPLATRGYGDSYPVNVAPKGIGFIPRGDHLEEFTDLFEGLIDEALEKGGDSNKEERLNALLEFYGSRKDISRNKLGTLELYGLRTWHNIQHDPRVSISYNGLDRSRKGEGPPYVAFEVRGVVEIIPKGSLLWRWQRNIHDLFHLGNAKKRRASDWPVAVYNIHIIEVIDKRPGRNASKEIIE